MNSPWLALITLGCFCVLASIANGKYPPPKYRTPAERYSAYTTKPVTLWKRDRAAETLAAVYGITPENMDSYRRWW